MEDKGCQQGQPAAPSAPQDIRTHSIPKTAVLVRKCGPPRHKKKLQLVLEQCCVYGPPCTPRLTPDLQGQGHREVYRLVRGVNSSQVTPDSPSDRFIWAHQEEQV